jgi:hypothetical protein
MNNRKNIIAQTRIYFSFQNKNKTIKLRLYRDIVLCPYTMSRISRDCLFVSSSGEKVGNLLLTRINNLLISKIETLVIIQHPIRTLLTPKTNDESFLRDYFVCTGKCCSEG